MTVKAQEQFLDEFILPEGHHWEDVTEAADTERKVDGKYVLARMQGPICGLGVKSRNNRYYPETLWPKAFAEANKRIQENGGIPGTIGHTRKIDDEAVESGNISHLVTKLWIPPGSKVGMAEVLVFGEGTAGSKLNTYLRGGWDLPVSTRGHGKYKGTTSEGVPIVDPDSYYFESLDFVRVGGIAGAKLSIKEHDENDETTTTNEDERMSLTKEEVQKMIESGGGSDIKTQLQLLEATKDLNRSETEIAELKKEIAEYKAICGSVVETKEMNEGLRKWLELPEFRDLAQQTSRFDQGPQTGKAFPAIVKQLMRVSEAYAELDLTPAEVKEVVEELEGFKGYCSSLEGMKVVAEAFIAYSTMGTPTELKEYLDTAKELEEALAKEQAASDKVKLVSTYKIKEEFAESLLEEMSYEKAEALIKKMSESKSLDELYKKPENGSPTGSKTTPTNKVPGFKIPENQEEFSPEDREWLNNLAGNTGAAPLAEMFGEIKEPKEVVHPHQQRPTNP